MNTAFFRTENKAYELHCDQVHIDPSFRVNFGKLASNSIISSKFSFFESELNPRALGLKYVVEGLETYLLKGKRYRIPAGKYLLVNETSGKMEIGINGPETHSLCVNMEPRLFNEMLRQLTQPDSLDEQKQVAEHLLTPEIFVREASASPGFQQFLSGLFELTATGKQEVPQAEMLFELTGLLVQENLEVIKSYHKLRTSKLSTRQELFQRLLKGKEMLDDSVFSEVNISQVAADCCLSEFRFYRLFKQCFGVSPYNYLFRRRISKGLELRKQNLSWGEIAYQLNFTDLAAFSNGFKKVTGVPPTKFKLETV